MELDSEDSPMAEGDWHFVNDAREVEAREAIDSLTKRPRLAEGVDDSIIEQEVASEAGGSPPSHSPPIASSNMRQLRRRRQLRNRLRKRVLQRGRVWLNVEAEAVVLEDLIDGPANCDELFPFQEAAFARPAHGQLRHTL